MEVGERLCLFSRVIITSALLIQTQTIFLNHIASRRSSLSGMVRLLHAFPFDRSSSGKFIATGQAHHRQTNGRRKRGSMKATKKRNENVW